MEKKEASGNILEMRQITKEFPGVVALNKVDFELKPGEIHAIIGENGAGKSTLMKVLSGVYPFGSYEGDVLLNGETVQFLSPRNSTENGISIVYQEIVIVPDLTVGENIFLGNMQKTKYGTIDWDMLYAESEKFLQRIGLSIDPKAVIKTLTVGEQQLVQIAKAIKDEPKILILDEPTSSLADSEIENLFKVIDIFCQAGGACIYISHKIEEVERISDRVTVLRDGEKIITQNKDETSREEIITYIVGRELKDMYPKSSCDIGDVIFSVKNLTQRESELGGDKKRLKNISFDLRKGEILGVSGLFGSGRTELCMGLFGTLPEVVSRELYIHGEKTNIKTPEDAVKNGLVLLTEDRRRYGLVSVLSTLSNITLASLKKYRRKVIIDSEKETEAASRMVDSLSIKVPTLDTIVENLSGGNQQKTLLARWILTDPKIFILDEPTKGIDVGAKVGIFKIINSLVEQGAGVILISSELEELLGICDRILVMHEGSINGEFSRNEFDAEGIMHCAMASNTDIGGKS